MTPARTSRRRVGAVAATCAVALIALTWFVLRTPTGQRWDLQALVDVATCRSLSSGTLVLLGRVPIAVMAGLAVVVMLHALVRRELRVAAGSAILVLGANLTTQLLKHEVLHRSDAGLGTLNSLPSGHTTMAASLAAAAVVAAPVRVRHVAAGVGAAAVTVTGCTTLLGWWHRPSDVIAAVLVVVLWSAAVGAVLGARPAARRQDVVFSVGGALVSVAAMIGSGARSVTTGDDLVAASAVLVLLAVVSAAGMAACCALARQP